MNTYLKILLTLILVIIIAAIVALSVNYAYDAGYDKGWNVGYTEAWQDNPTPESNPETVRAFVGSRLSDVYHYPWCEYVQKMHPGNWVWFSDPWDAKNHGYRPCKVCNPP